MLYSIHHIHPMKTQRSAGPLAFNVKAADGTQARRATRIAAHTEIQTTLTQSKANMEVSINGGTPKSSM